MKNLELSLILLISFLRNRLLRNSLDRKYEPAPRGQWERITHMMRTLKCDVAKDYLNCELWDVYSQYYKAHYLAVQIFQITVPLSSI